MSRTRSVEAVILRTIDIGDADRFCILFTKETGRKGARARGVRKTTSRLGGLLLPFRHVRLDLAESDHSCTITSAMHIENGLTGSPDMQAFVRWERGVELLLALTEEDEAMPAVFDLLLSFLIVSGDTSIEPLIPFQLRLLALLGLLPSSPDDKRFARLSPQGQLFIHACEDIRDLKTLATLPIPEEDIKFFLDSVLVEHLTRPLKSADRAFDLV